jgi:hypothetical protein
MHCSRSESEAGEATASIQALGRKAVTMHPSLQPTQKSRR